MKKSGLLLILTISSITAAPLIDYVKNDAQVAQESKGPGYLKDEYLTEFTNPWEYGDPDEKIEFRFENASLQAFIDFIAQRFHITFLQDEALDPVPAGGGKAKGQQISFTTHKPFSKKEAWGIFTSFLDLAGLTVIPGPAPRVYKIAPVGKDSPLSPGKNPLPLYIDTPLESLPSDDTVIRYIVFVKNTGMDTIGNLIEQVRSPQSPRVIGVPDMRAFILTDKASNIKNMLAMIQELDQSSPTETLQILKLDRIDATKAVNLYKDLTKIEEPSLTARLLGQRKKPTTSFFSENVRLTPVPHINSIVMIGTKDAVQRVYDFIHKTLDRPAEGNPKPIFTYALKNKNAEMVARILNSATKFQQDTEAAKTGGVRDGDKYFKSVYVEPEVTGNRLIIYAEYEDYTSIYNLLKKIDVEEPQIAIKVLLLNIQLSEDKELGFQIRNKVPGVNGLLGKNVNFQTSGLAGTVTSAGTTSPVVENPNGTGATRLLGDLIQLAQISSPGSTLLTLGADMFGVWGLFALLEQLTKTSVVANPFIITTNNYPATISVGEIRRVLDAAIQNGSSTATNAYKDLAANLTLAVTPQISTDGLITMDVLINYEQFSVPDSSASSGQNSITSGNRSKQAISTSVTMGNNEVLALGGLIQDTVQDTITKVPILSDIPILGNLFTNTVKSTLRNSLLVLIMPEIIPTNSDDVADKITEDKVLDTKAVFYAENPQRDPFLRWFFKDQVQHGEAVVDEFVNLKDKYLDESEYVRLDRPQRLKRKAGSSLLHHLQSEESATPPVAPEKTVPLTDATAQVARMAEARFGSTASDKNKKEPEKSS